MFSIQFKLSAVMIAAVMVNSAAAQYPQQQPYQRGPVQQANAAVQQGAAQPYQGGQYPQLNSALYPSPVQYTPPWNGGTIITNQAFAPHEMLYPHDYHGMYGPFYYKVKGSWVWTPFGMRQHENWELQGTEVKVKYRSQIPLLSGFHPPRHR